jgi:hypothetical protein
MVRRVDRLTHSVALFGASMIRAQTSRAVSCDLLGCGAGLELLIGYTRLGNLLALLDREEVPEIQKHLVWVGRMAKVD